jgi:hypothetical protein
MGGGGGGLVRQKRTRWRTRRVNPPRLLLPPEIEDIFRFGKLNILFYEEIECSM